MPMPKPRKGSTDDVWITSIPDVEGKRYHAEITHGQDTVLALTPENTVRWAAAISSAIAAAEYDAAVWRQMSELLEDMPKSETERKELIAQVVRDLRADRPEAYSVEGMEITPGVTLMGKPFFILSINGKRIGQWDVEHATDHMIACLRMAEVVQLDTSYLRILTESIGLERPRAMAMIHALQEHR